METKAYPGPPTLGLITADPLRALGLETILGAESLFSRIDVSAPGAVQTPGLEMILLDSSATDHLLPTIEAFARDMPQLRLLVLGPETAYEHIERVIGAGAKGYLPYGAREDELRMAVDIIRKGSVWAPRIVMARLVERGLRQQPAAAAAEPTLTGRERQVLKLLIAGQPNREIGFALGVDEGTVKAHVGRLMRKLGVANRTALTMQAIARKLS